MKKVAVNGFGRIGRDFTRMSLERTDMDVVVVNDLADIQTLAHLFKYDSVHRTLTHAFNVEGNRLVFENGKQIQFISERDPEKISWGTYGVDTVLESTGVFRTKKLASKHLTGGVKNVILSAPARSEGIKTVVVGINDDLLEPSDAIISNASCTTNSAAPMLKVMREICTIESVFLTTIHSYTSDQRIHDAPHRDLRRARAAGESIVPTTTGAADALTKIFPDLEGKVGGGAVRVPVPDGSITDLTLLVKNPPTENEIISAMKSASEGSLKGILSYTEDPIVSADIIGSPYSCIFDAGLVKVVGNMVKITGWYDNEAGYSNRLIDLIVKL